MSTRKNPSKTTTTKKTVSASQIKGELPIGAKPNFLPIERFEKFEDSVVRSFKQLLDEDSNFETLLSDNEKKDAQQQGLIVAALRKIAQLTKRIHILESKIEMEQSFNPSHWLVGVSVKGQPLFVHYEGTKEQCQNYIIEKNNKCVLIPVYDRNTILSSMENEKKEEEEETKEDKE